MLKAFVIERLNGVLCRFQQHFSHTMAKAHIIHVFPVFPVLSWGSEVSCPRTLPQKTQRTQCGSNPAPLDEESNTLPLTHAVPLKAFVTDKLYAAETRGITLPLHKRQIFRLVQNESICRRQNKCDSKIKICRGKSRKHCGKRRKCWLPAFSPFATMFSKGFFLKVIKRRDSVIKVQVTNTVPSKSPLPRNCQFSPLPRCLTKKSSHSRR